MGICPVVFVGYERDRHLFGINYLNKKLGIDRVYLLYDNIHPEFQKIAEKNVEYISSVLNSFFIEYNVMGCNPREIADIVRRLTYIMYKSKHSELYMDITHCTKEFVLASSFFAGGFGAKMYYVSSKRASIDRRIEEVFSELNDDPEFLSEFSKNLVKILNEEGKNTYQLALSISSFALDFIKEKYTGKVKERYRERVPTDVKISLAGNLIDLNDDLKKLLLTLYQVDRPVKTIAELTHLLGLKGKRNMAKVGYRVSLLEKWGLVKTKKTRKTETTLTEFGRGVAMGLLDIKKESSSV